MTDQKSAARPTYKQVLSYARKAVLDEVAAPSRWFYNRQAVEHDILNHFDGLTNSDDDYEFITEAIREAEYEYNTANNCEL